VVSWSQPEGYPRAVEFQGTLDYTGWLAAPTGLEVLVALGADRVRAHNDQLAGYGQRVVAQALGVTELPQPGAALPMRIIPLPAELSIDRQDLQALIADRLAAEVAVTRWRDRTWLRLCAQVYNTAGQYDRLAERLPALLATLR
jgi:isopenicillin-N epimerase